MVEWEDAASMGDGGWLNGEDALVFAKTPPPRMLTLGWMLHEDEDWVTLVDTLGPSETGSVHTIPRAMIKNIIELEVPDDAVYRYE